MRTYYHHFLPRGCAAPRCGAAVGAGDLYLVGGGRPAVRACCGDHAREAEAAASVPEPEPALDGFDTWATWDRCGALTAPCELSRGEGARRRCAAPG